MSERSKRIDKTLDRLQITKEEKLRKDLDYTFPTSYEASDSLFERIRRSLEMNQNMVMESKVREDLKDESTFLFFGTLALTSILQIIILSLDPESQIVNPTLLVTFAFALNFALGYGFLFFVSLFMNLLVPTEKGLDRSDVFRICAYPYTSILFNSLFGLIAVITGIRLFGLFALLALIYFFALLIVTLRVAYDTNKLYAIFGIIVPYTISLLVFGQIVAIIFSIIFG